MSIIFKISLPHNGLPIVQWIQNLPANAGDTGDLGSFPELGRSPEREMAAHSSFVTWEIPWTVEPGGLQSMGLERVGHE